MSSSDPVQAGCSTPKTFEFTKRKRWADLLITELADGINFILSESCIVLYCGPAVTEITGWKDTDFLDRDFTDFIETTDDQATFRASFDESLQQNSGLHSFVRIKCTGNLPSYSTTFPEDMLFEIRGEPRSTDTEGAFLFVMAKPYPSRNTEIQNTYLDLKMENDRLQRRRLELSNRLPKKLPSLPPIMPGHIYATPSRIHGTSTAGGLLGIDASGSYYPSTFGGLPGFDTLLSSSFNSTLYEGSTYRPPFQGLIGGDENEEGSRRKKVKKTPAGEQYVCVTCGRTDSPEWRKGPLGPKTLCNACGLRWAKQTRIGKFVDNPQVGDGVYGA